jgi:hypothetical protein
MRRAWARLRIWYVANPATTSAAIEMPANISRNSTVLDMYDLLPAALLEALFHFSGANTRNNAAVS